MYILKTMPWLLKLTFTFSNNTTYNWKQDAKVYADWLIQKDERDRQEEARKAKLRQDRAMQNRLAIEEQMEKKKTAVSAVGFEMSKEELRMNKPILERIKSESDIYSEIGKRLIAHNSGPAKGGE